MHIKLRTFIQFLLIGIMLTAPYAQEKAAKAPAPYTWGTELLFKRGGNAVAYADAGWRFEKGMAWTVARDESNKSVLTLPVQKVARDVKLTLKVGGAYGSQRLLLSANGDHIGKWWVFSRSQIITVTLPAKALMKGTPLRLTFHTPDAKSPEEATGGASNDSDQLGVSVLSLKLE